VGLFQSIVSGTFSHATEVHDPLKVLDDRNYKIRKTFEQTVRNAILDEHKEEAPKIAESVTGYVFDFGDFDFEQRTPLAFKKACETTLRNAYLVVDLPSELISAVIIHRGYRQGRSASQVVSQLVNLFDLALAIVGPRARASGPYLYTVHKELFEAVITVEPPPERLARHLTRRDDGKIIRDKIAASSGGTTSPAATSAPSAGPAQPS
jgi:hypothetical protein